MDLNSVFNNKEAEVFYKVLPLLGLVSTEKRARNVFCEYQRAKREGGAARNPWPGVKIREFGGRFLIFKADLEAAANDSKIIIGESNK